MNRMLTPSEALELTLADVPVLETETIVLSRAKDRVLARDIPSPIDHPIFDQSAVDGYAFRYADWQGGQSLRIVDQVRAGDAGERALGTGECSRIFTGAPLPPGADTVVMQEFVTREGDVLRINDTGLRLSGNVRGAGEQIRKGAMALKAGVSVNPAAIGFLASLGVGEVMVYRQPRVSVIVTGDEFAEHAGELLRGKIFESNGKMLVAALEQQGCIAEYDNCRDDAGALAAMVEEKARRCDLLILTGGVSVGDYDFSRGALEANGCEIVYHQVAQKPGKPLLFSRRGRLRAFGLPGNPRAVLMCYYLYVLPLLDAMRGVGVRGLRVVQFPLVRDYRRKPDGKVHFVTGVLSGNGVSVLEGQQSHMLQSFALADVIVRLPAEPGEFVAGTVVECYWVR